MKLEHYMVDGAGAQARAVLAYLQGHDSLIEESWSDEWKKYMAEPMISRFDNCREQGYIVSLKSRYYTHQINIAFYEYRSSDTICALMVEGYTFNAPTKKDIMELCEKEGMPDSSGNYQHSESYGKASEMAEWIGEQLREFWTRTVDEKPKRYVPATEHSVETVVDQYANFVKEHTDRESMESATTEVIAKHFGVRVTEAQTILKIAAKRNLITNLASVGAENDWIANHSEKDRPWNADL